MNRTSTNGPLPPNHVVLDSLVLDALPVVRLPATAASPAGLRSWAARAECARSVRFRHAGDQICIDYGPGAPRIHLPVSALTSLDGFCDWATSDDFPEHGLFSYLDGEVLIDMSPERLETHNKVKTEIYLVIGLVNRRLDLGELYSDRALLKNVEANLSTEPDGLFATWKSSKAKRIVFPPDRPLEAHGTPDWLLEIISPTSVHKDKVELREKYHRAGVREFWLIDARGPNIEFQILVWRKKGYVAVRPRNGWLRSPLFGHWFRLERRRNRAGRWQYTLRVSESDDRPPGGRLG